MNETFMKEKPLLPLLDSMSLPMVISMLVNSLYNIVDSFFVAKISEDTMTALSLVYPVQNFINAVAIGFGVGINAVIAYHLGSQEQEKANRAASWGFVLSLVHGAVMMVGCIAIMPVFLRMFTEEEQVINIFMELSALGIAQPLSSNILQFMKALPACAKEKGISFSTPSEIVTKFKSVDQVDVPYPMSWADEERDTSCWLGNVMQREAFNKLYSVAGRVHLCDDRRIKQDWDYLQASNNFRFMTTKKTGIWLNRGIYDSPYDAFTNYMNILGDFISRVDALYPVEIENEELNSLLTTIKNQGEEIEKLQKELDKYKKKAAKKAAAE